VAVCTAYATDLLFFAANEDARLATTPPGAATRSGAVAGGRDINDCDTLRAGYWYNGPGAISSTTVQLCTADFFCNTEDLAIDVAAGTDTAAGAGGTAPGRNPCPAGVDSEVGSDSINDCNILEPGFYYTGPVTTAISATSVAACPVKFYW
jgi:hypothetical protein